MWQITVNAKTADPNMVGRITADLNRWRELGVSVSYSKEDLVTGEYRAGMSFQRTLGLERDESAPPPVPAPKRPWAPPQHVLGVVVPESFVLVRTEEVAVAVWGLTVFASGLRFTVASMSRRSRLPMDRSSLRFRFEEGSQVPSEVLRFGLSCADGSQAVNTEQQTVLQQLARQDQDSRVLFPEGGRGSGTEFLQGYWCWPLPPPGEIAFFCEWPAFGIPLTEHKITAEPILTAASRSQSIWPEP